MKDYFVSYNTKDERWAEWISWQLEELGYSVIMQRWDFNIGSNFVLEMERAINYSKKIILVLSEEFMASQFTPAEWASFFARDPTGSKRLIIPIRVKECKPVGLISQIVYLDFVGKAETQCKDVLKKLHNGGRNKPLSEPEFPATVIFPPEKKLFGNKKNAGKKFAKGIINDVISGEFSPFHIKQRRHGRSFLNDVLNHLVNFHYKKRSVSEKLSIMIIDVDGMSGINKFHGISIGDGVLRNLSNMVENEEARLVSGRMGDDTLFCILNGTPINKVIVQSENLIKEIGQYNWEALSEGLFVKCSIGVCEFSDIESVNDTLVRGLKALIKARKNGGNRVESIPMTREHTDFSKFEPLEEPVRWTSYGS